MYMQSHISVYVVGLFKICFLNLRDLIIWLHVTLGSGPVSVTLLYACLSLVVSNILWYNRVKNPEFSPLIGKRYIFNMILQCASSELNSPDPGLSASFDRCIRWTQIFTNYFVAERSRCVARPGRRPTAARRRPAPAARAPGGGRGRARRAPPRRPRRLRSPRSRT